MEQRFNAIVLVAAEKLELRSIEGHVERLFPPRATAFPAS
jgi:hypothetical protein